MGLHPSCDTLLHKKPGVEDALPRIGQAAKSKSRFSCHWDQGGDVRRSTFRCHHPASNHVLYMQLKGRALTRPHFSQGTPLMGLSKFHWSSHAACRSWEKPTDMTRNKSQAGCRKLKKDTGAGEQMQSCPRVSQGDTKPCLLQLQEGTGQRSSQPQKQTCPLPPSAVEAR